MKKISKELNKLIDFFKLTGNYDEKIFVYLLNHMNIDDSLTSIDDYKNYCVKKSFYNNKLKELKLFVPRIKNINTMLINIYVFAHAINDYNFLGKELKYSNVNEILPVSLVRIYSVLYLKRHNQIKINEFEYKNYFSNKKEELLIAYNYSLNITTDFLKTSKILIPNEFYIDKERAEESLSINLDSIIDKPKSKS